MMWVLILWIHAGPLSDHDSMALASVAGFATRAACDQAGRAASELPRGTMKSAKFVCVEQPKAPAP